MTDPLPSLHPFRYYSFTFQTIREKHEFRRGAGVGSEVNPFPF